MTKKLSIGDWVEVRSKEEILATLDSNGWLDGMPLMPEMLQYCGRKFQVYKSAHKTCDYSGPQIRSRRVESTVHLKTRCDGSAHDGCQAGCLLYWKEAWLKPIGHKTDDPVSPSQGDHSRKDAKGAAKMPCTESDLLAHTSVPDPQGGPPTYICQTTQIPFATKDLQWWEMGQYFEDYRSGNVSLVRLLRGAIYSTYLQYQLFRSRNRPSPAQTADALAL